MREFFLKTVPGYTSSGPDHWQTQWERSDPTIKRIEQKDWNNPDPVEWATTLDVSIVPSEASSTVLIGHSCGSLAIAHWVEQFRKSVAGGFLVAPPDVDRPDMLEELRAFGPVPLPKFPFPSLVVASEDDPHCSPERAKEFAQAWGSDLVLVGRQGHLNTASGHGPWPQGLEVLKRFCAKLIRP